MGHETEDIRQLQRFPLIYENLQSPSGIKWVFLDEDKREREKQVQKRREKSMRRYWHYVEKELPAEVVTPVTPHLVERIKQRIPTSLLSADYLHNARQALLDELIADHNTAGKRAVLDYLLLDSSEQRRLEILYVEPSHTSIAVRAPVPWHAKLQSAHESIQAQLFITNPMMSRILDVFSATYSQVKIIDMSVFEMQINKSTPRPHTGGATIPAETSVEIARKDVEDTNMGDGKVAPSVMEKKTMAQSIAAANGITPGQPMSASSFVNVVRGMCAQWRERILKESVYTAPGALI